MEVKLKVHSCSQKNGRAGNQGVPRRGTSAFLLAPVVGAGQRTKGSTRLTELETLGTHRSLAQVCIPSQPCKGIQNWIYLACRKAEDGLIPSHVCFLKSGGSNQLFRATAVGCMVSLLPWDLD